MKVGFDREPLVKSDWEVIGIGYSDNLCKWPGELLELMEPFHFVDRKEKVLIECVADLGITRIYLCKFEKHSGTRASRFNWKSLSKSLRRAK